MLPTFAFQAVKAATVTCVPCARAAARRASSSASAFFRAAAGSSLTEQTALAAPHRSDMGGIVGAHAVVFTLARKGGVATCQYSGMQPIHSRTCIAKGRDQSPAGRIANVQGQSAAAQKPKGDLIWTVEGAQTFPRQLPTPDPNMPHFLKTTSRPIPRQGQTLPSHF